MPSMTILLGGIAVLICVALYWCIIRIEQMLVGVPSELSKPGARYILLDRLPIRSRLCTIATLIANLKSEASEGERRYKTLTDNLAAGVIMHQPDGSIHWCSPYIEVLTGYSRSEIYIDKDTFLMAHIHEDDHASIRHALAIASSGEPFQCRYRFYHKSGLCLWLETRTAPIYDPALQTYVALSITLDVTASVNAQLKVEERNRDLNEFTYMVSHDLKAPIVTLRGMLEIVKEECQRARLQQSSEPIEYMSKAIDRLEKLVEGVLELAQVSTTDRDLEAVDLRKVVTEIEEDYNWQAEQAKAQIVVEGDLPWVFGNRTQLYQVFSNLIGNALKYRVTSRQVIITIRASKRTSRRRAVIEVSDNGRGIAPEFHQAIFAPFARAGETIIEGSGVGLATVKRILDKLGGTIFVESVVDQGSTFIVELRRAVDEEGHSDS